MLSRVSALQATLRSQVEEGACVGSVQVFKTCMFRYYHDSNLKNYAIFLIKIWFGVFVNEGYFLNGITQDEVV